MPPLSDKEIIEKLSDIGFSRIGIATGMLSSLPLTNADIKIVANAKKALGLKNIQDFIERSSTLTAFRQAERFTGEKPYFFVLSSFYRQLGLLINNPELKRRRYHLILHGGGGCR